MRRLACTALLAACVACTPHPAVAPLPDVSSPAFPEFVEPVVPPALAAGAAAAGYHRGWRFLQAGDIRNAEREFTTALKSAPAFYPAETGLGYVELARKSAQPALVHFDRALERQRHDVSAMVGQGLTLMALNRESDALAAFEAALAANPKSADLARRVEVVRFRAQQRALEQAREAVRTGRLDEAAAAYARLIEGSPDSAVLYRELAAVERQQGEGGPALDHLRKAAALDPADARSLIQVGELLESRQDLDGAVKAYADALAIEPNGDVDQKLRDLRQRLQLARLPPEYKAIETAAQVTRADVAALVGVRILPLLPAGRRQETVLITDVRDNWAASWIVSVARAGVMQPFANHAFQPRSIVRRTEMAQVVNRLLTRLPPGSPGVPPGGWQSAREKFADLAEGHVAYVAASAAVASGVMKTDVNGNFFPSRPVSGTEAMEAVSHLETLARTTPAKATSSK